MVKKTSPTGIRFDVDQLDFIKKREKLESPQKVVNFLLQAYWDVWHVPKNPFNIQQATEPQKEKEQPKTPLTPFETYKVNIKAAGSIDDIKKLVDEASKDANLGHWHKENIKKYGVEVSQTLDF